MTEKPQSPFDPTTMFQTWMKAATDFWGEAARYWMTNAGGPGGGMTMSPEAGLAMADAWFKGFTLLQRNILDKAAGPGAADEGCGLEEADRVAFKVWTDFYEKEIQGFFNIPPLGMARAYQERANQMMDRFNQYQAALTQFLYLTFLPMEKTLRALRRESAARPGGEEQAESLKEIYRKWIGDLEGHYTMLLRSPEYIEALTGAVDAYAGFLTARRKWMEDLLKDVPVPSQRDVDEISRELYALKKEIRALRKSAAGASRIPRGTRGR